MGIGSGGSELFGESGGGRLPAGSGDPWQLLGLLCGAAAVAVAQRRATGCGFAPLAAERVVDFSGVGSAGFGFCSGDGGFIGGAGRGCSGRGFVEATCDS